MKPNRIVPMAVMALALAATTAGCARQISPDVREGWEAGAIVRTAEATIESVRQVEIQEHDTLERNGTGQILGSLAGGIAGARFGNGLGQLAAIAGGAIAGAFIGALAEQEAKRQVAAEYIIRTGEGELLTILQGAEPALLPGQRVYLQESRYGRSRVIPAT